ncbi:YjiH family protein [Tepidibacillus infernus]|uniref:Histidine transporter n=1 Tax=Tepidibacillus decaturensis TaxID=1413211 RepID=A0A135L690_9BACI|nr:YjiH family protein [Tepidibacillus decaturensis]KXG44544.1 histidine transporter [Tepidibacillus decaturensis]
MSKIETVNPEIKQIRTNNSKNIAKFSVYSLIGIFMFFIPITINGKSSIMLDHLVTFVRDLVPNLVPYYLLIIIASGAIYPFVKGTWKKDKVNIVLSFFKILGLIIAFMINFQFGPAWLFTPDMGPFLFNSLVTPVGILVPIGAVFLAMLVSYGLLEFIGVLMQPIMRPVWKTPGRSAIDAVASFVGSYSIGLLITNRVFKEGKYTIKEAAIIATGFSTVSATFMVVVAKTLGLMDIWNIYFWVTLIVTFLVTVITVRLWPLSKMSDGYYNDIDGQPEEKFQKDRLKVAWKEAMNVAEQAPNLLLNIWMNLKDGLVMTMAILPSIMSIGLLGLVLAEYTPVFDILGYIFYPFTWLVRLPEPFLAAKAASMEIAEMFLPALLVTEATLITKFVIGVVSVSAIIFFSAVVPVILSTDIPISILKLLVIWIERTILTIVITAPIAYLLL